MELYWDEGEARCDGVDMYWEQMERAGTSPIGDDVEFWRSDFVLCAVFSIMLVWCCLRSEEISHH